MSKDPAHPQGEGPDSQSATGLGGGTGLSPFDAEIQRRLAEVTHHLSHTEVSRLTGFPRETCRRYLRNGSANVEFLAVLCEVLGVSVHWLLLGVGPRKRDALPGDWLGTVKPADLLMEVGRRWHGMQASLADIKTRLSRLEMAPHPASGRPAL